jgi:hypothetical protein
MAKYPIPVHVSKTESGGTKILTSKKKVGELGANAFIVSKAAADRLMSPKIVPTVDYEKLAMAAAQAVLTMPACSLPNNPLGVIRRAMEAADD